MTQQLGVDVEHRPSVFAVRARRTTDGQPGWAYRVACACGAQTHPWSPLPWRLAMHQAIVHVRFAQGRRRTIDEQVAAFRARLEQ